MADFIKAPFQSHDGSRHFVSGGDGENMEKLSSFDSSRHMCRPPHTITCSQNSIGFFPRDGQHSVHLALCMLLAHFCFPFSLIQIIPGTTCQSHQLVYNSYCYYCYCSSSSNTSSSSATAAADCYCYYYYYNSLMAFFQQNLGKPAPER